MNPPSNTWPGEPLKAKLKKTLFVAANVTSSARFTTSSTQPKTPLKSRLDNYRSINALAESFNGLYKSELIHRQGPWHNVEHVEWATLNYVDWFNNRRIHESLDYVPLVEFEAHYYDSNESESLAELEMI
jgi:hypothetical protein